MSSLPSRNRGLTPPARRNPANPFYVLLVIAGVVFLITAISYGVMAFRADLTGRSGMGQAASPLMDFLDEHGAQLLGWEIVVLGVTTAAAMLLDRFRSGRQERSDLPASQDSADAGERGARAGASPLSK